MKTQHSSQKGLARKYALQWPEPNNTKVPESILRIDVDDLAASVPIFSG